MVSYHGMVTKPFWHAKKYPSYIRPPLATMPTENDDNITPDNLPRLFVVRHLPQNILQAVRSSSFRRRWLVSGGVLRPQDAVFLPECLTGAGEFEGLRFIGASKANATDQDPLPLLQAGIEGPIFPQTTVVAVGGPQHLRHLYEPILEQILLRQGFSLGDFFDNLEEFWRNPDVGPDLAKDEEEPLLIPWNECDYELIVPGSGASQ